MIVYTQNKNVLNYPWVPARGLIVLILVSCHQITFKIFLGLIWVVNFLFIIIIILFEHLTLSINFI